MYKHFILSVLILALGGCVSTRNIPLENNSQSTINGGSITEVRRETPDFAAMTAGKALFAMAGAFAMITAGNEIIRENGVDDPAIHISQSLSNALAEKYQLTKVDPDQVMAASEDVGKLSQQYHDTDLLMDVRTINWSFGYFPTDWDNYRIMYSAKMRLIDTRRKTTLAEGFCSYVPEKTSDAPSKEELLSDNATRLKSELQKAADYCIAEFSTNSLDLQATVARR